MKSEITFTVSTKRNSLLTQGSCVELADVTTVRWSGTATSCGTKGAWAGVAGSGAVAVISALLNLSTSCLSRLYALFCRNITFNGRSWLRFMGGTMSGKGQS